MGALVFGVKDVAEEGGVVAEELFVEDPVGVFGADVDVYEGVGEESAVTRLVALAKFQGE